MKESGSDIGIIFSRTHPKDFPKDAQFDHKGNIFLCKYDYDVLKTLAQTQRYLICQLSKERKSGQENELSALKFWENPKVKNATFKSIEDKSDTRKKLKSAKKNTRKQKRNLNKSRKMHWKCWKNLSKLGKQRKRKRRN